MSVNEMKFSLKIVVDSKAHKVVFAEAGKDFVDFLFYILSLPLSTVVKLLDKEKMAGSLQALHKSVESLKPEYFDGFANKDTVLQPKLPIDLPLLSFHSTTFTYFKCPDHNYVSDRAGKVCPHTDCFKGMCQEKFTAKTLHNEAPGFVKAVVAYMVMDNLEVKPMSVTLVRSLISDFDYYDEQDVQFGLKEGLTLLRASLETNDVLTTVFLESRKKTRN